MIAHSDDRHSFGALLKAFRKRQRLTQQQLAAAIGIHRHAISRWEQGNVLPASKTMVLEVAKHLHLDEQETRKLLEASLTGLAPYWMVPLPRNPFFTGREGSLEALHMQLGVHQTAAPARSFALYGLGGVGKTQIALEYVYRYALEYSAVFWIGAETSESIVTSLLRIVKVLQLPEREDRDQQRAVAALQRWLSTHSQWLLIWDSLEDLALLDYFLPSARSGAILLTTRCQTLGTRAQGLDLLPMEQEEGIAFLLRRAKLLDPQATSEQVCQFAVRESAHYAAAAELVTAMGGLPLALDQAGAYLEETRCGLPAYLELFRTRRTLLLQQRGEGARDHPASVSATFALAIAATAQRHPAVWDLLRICALLQPEAIPEELFRQGGAHLGATLETVCCDALEWNRVVAIACSYSLLFRQSEEQTLSMHRLVQAVLLDTMTEAEQKQWTWRAINVLDMLFPKIQMLREYAAWKQGERLLPHALLCLHRVEESSEPLILASLASKTAQHLYEHGRYAEAEPLYRRVLCIWKQSLGPEHSLMAESLSGLAQLYREQGKYAEARALFQQALSIREKYLGQHHPETAETLHDLALFHQKQGNLGEALSLAEQALAIRLQSLGDAHPKTVSSRTFCAQLGQEKAEARNEASCQQSKEECQAEEIPLALREVMDPSPCEGDPLQGFLDAYCMQHPRSWCRASDLWQAYEHWAAEHQERFPLSRRAFSAQLRAHGCRADRTNTARIWRGITLANPNWDEESRKGTHVEKMAREKFSKMKTR